MELDRGWKYKHGSAKPPLVCPYCGANDTDVDYDGDCSCGCPHCCSEWHETDGYWYSVQATGYIEK